MTRKETDSVKLPEGYWWVNIAPLGEPCNWQMQIEPQHIDINSTTIFGYERDAFLARQYK